MHEQDIFCVGSVYSHVNFDGDVVAVVIDDVEDNDEDDDDDEDVDDVVVVPAISLFGSSLIFKVAAPLPPPLFLVGDDNDVTVVVVDDAGHNITGFAIHSCHTRSGIVVVDGIGLCIVAEWPRSLIDFSDIGTGGTVLHFFSKFSSSISVTKTYLDG